MHATREEAACLTVHIPPRIPTRMWGVLPCCKGPWCSVPAWKVGDRGFYPTLAFKFQRDQMFLPRSLWIFNIVGSFRDWEVAWSALDRQGLNFESCVLGGGGGGGLVSSQSPHNPQENILAQCSLCAQRWPETPLILFHLISLLQASQLVVVTQKSGATREKM